MNCADEILDYALLVIGGKVPCLLRVKRYHRQRRSANAKHACEKQNITDTNIFSKASERYSEGDVARLVNSRRKRSEAVVLPS